MDKDLKSGYYDTKSFKENIFEFQPKIVCFNGKEAARIFFNLKAMKEVQYGLREQFIGATKLFVAPSTSLQAIAY